MAETIHERQQIEMKYVNVKAGPVAVLPKEVEVRSVPVQAVHPRLVTAGEPRQKRAYSQRERNKVRGKKKPMEI